MLFRKLKLDWKYGISELLIVVAGVLIALAANGLLQERQDQSLELEYLEGLIADLRLDTAQLSIHIAEAERLGVGRDRRGAALSQLRRALSGDRADPGTNLHPGVANRRFDGGDGGGRILGPIGDRTGDRNPGRDHRPSGIGRGRGGELYRRAFLPLAVDRLSERPGTANSVDRPAADCPPAGARPTSPSTGDRRRSPAPEGSHLEAVLRKRVCALRAGRPVFR